MLKQIGQKEAGMILKAQVVIIIIKISKLQR